MSARRRIALRLVALAGALGCAGALVLLFEFGPPGPPLPRSLSTPVTLAFVRGLLALAAWLLLVLLAGVVLVRFVRVIRPGRRPPPRALKDGAIKTRRSFGHARLLAGSGPAFAPPFPLIVRAPEPETAATLLAPSSETSEEVPPATTQQDSSAPVPSIGVLGPLEVRATKPRRRGIRSQTQELLAYLALHTEGATTDELAAMLWPDVDGHKARQRLWRSISETRAHLGEVFVRKNERYVLNREAVAVDLDEFEHLLAGGEQVQGADRQQLLERALALVRGDPLASSDYVWADGDVRHLRGTIAERLEQLGYLRLDVGDATGALEAAERRLAFDSLNEPLQRLAMQAEAVLGLRGAVADRYEALLRQLEERLGLEPERETRALYFDLLGQS